MSHQDVGAVLHDDGVTITETAIETAIETAAIDLEAVAAASDGKRSARTTAMSKMDERNG